MNPHRTHRPDNNRDEIVAAFERLGYSVINFGNVGEGVPDIMVIRQDVSGNCIDGWYTKFVEIKNGNKSYTQKEQAFFDRYPGLPATVRSVEDVERMFG